MSKLKEKYLIVESHECTTAEGLAHILRFYAGKDTYIKFRRSKRGDVVFHIISPSTDYSLLATVKPVANKFLYIGLDRLTYMPQVASFLFEAVNEIGSIDIEYCIEENV
jgi:hypothetical protein